MNDGWELKTLGDLYTITSSKRVFESEWTLSGVPFYRAREIVRLARDGRVDNELFISEAMFAEYSSKYGAPAEGDLMVTGVGTLGITYVVKNADRFYFKDGNILWFKRKSNVDSRFVDYAFRSDFLRRQIDNSVGATVGTYTIVKAKSTFIPVPPLAEQRRIVGILDEAFAGIAVAKRNAEQNLQNARALFESHLQAIFTQRGDGWVDKTVEECCLVGDGNHSSNYPKKDELVSTGVPFIRATNLVNGRISQEDMRFLSPEKHAQLKKGHLRTGDILITNRGEIGKTAIVDETHDNSNLNSQIAWLRCKSVMDNRFLFHTLNSGEIQRHFQESKSGTALQQFTIRQLKSLVIPSPPLVVQRTLVAQLDSLDEETQRLAALYQQKLTALDELKKSLLARAFAGELASAIA